MKLEDVFELENKKEAERILIESGVIVDWREEEEGIVQYFANALGERLTADFNERTASLEIVHFKFN